MTTMRWRAALAALALAALTALAYAGVARNAFIALDDQEYLVNNPMVRRGLSLPGLAWAFATTHTGNWHPLTWLSHMLDVQLFGMNPGAHHMANLLIHTAGALLLLRLLLRLTGALWPSLLVAALFALHPLHVESVAWASERKDVLANFLLLGAMLAYARAARRNEVPSSVALPLLFALALLAKPMPVSLPFLLLLLDWWPLGRWMPGRGKPPLRPGGGPGSNGMLPPARLWLEKLPLFLLAAASSAVTLYAQTRGGAVVSREVLPLAARAANALLSYTGYLLHACWPSPLAIYYPHPVHLPAWYLVAGAFAALAAISIAAAAGACRFPWVATGWFWYLGSLVPVIGIVQVGQQAMADRYTYLPLTGIFTALAWSLARLAARRPSLRAPAALAALSAVLALATLTSRQVALWRDTSTLFGHAIALTGGNAVAQNSMGVALSAENRFAEALDRYREAVRLNPWNADFVFNRGTALEALGNIPAAEESYRVALELDPSHSLAWNNLGIVLGKLGRSTEAAIAYRRALGIDPGLPQAHFNLGVILASQGRTAEATACYRTTLALDPASVQAHTNLGAILAGQGKFLEAIAHFRAVVAREPGSAAAHRNLANALLAQGDRDGAAAESRLAATLDAGPTEALRDSRNPWTAGPP